MIKQDRHIRVKVSRWIDGVVFELGLLLAYSIRSHWGNVVEVLRKLDGIRDLAHYLRYDLAGVQMGTGPYQPDSIGSLTDYLPLFIVALPICMFILESQGYYERAVFVSPVQRIWQLGKACVLSTIGLILVIYLMRGEQARGVMVLFGACAFALMCAKEEALRWWRRSQLGASQYTRRAVLCGEPGETAALRAEMRKSRPDLEVVGEIDLNTASISELVSFVHEFSVNSVVLTGRHTAFGRMEEAIQACELEGVEAWLVANFFQTRISQTSVGDFCGRPLLVFHSTPQLSSWAGLLKQVFDIVGAAVLLVVTIPLFFLAAMLIKVTSPGPVFFRQKRAGLNGKPFNMFKFRSMVTNAEQLKHELAALNEMSGPVFKVTNDPRVTRVGRILRKTSIDEIPQLFNVLLGDMSLVGPRPLPVDEVKRFDDLAHRRRLSVKPGMTCLWQVSGRNKVSDFKEWVRLDLEYIDHWSLWLDIKILWWTIPVVLFGRGAS
jgi:exopolysaccharide biosynthesis polyprenyl glycosylphosphotransferase